ncbi:MAG: N-acetylmuramidase domain-containing protein [Prevotella sp.]|nr:N-acetylmuramidase domain-containing protein [Prevotella sp.]
MFVRFIKGNRWDGYLRNLDWKEFARHYNESGYAQNEYDKKLEKAYAKYK